MTTRQLIDDLTTQRDLYAQLAKLAERQHLCVEQELPDDLLEVLNERAAVLELITQIEPRLRPIKLAWQQLSQRLPADVRDTAARLMNESRELLQQITRADEDDSLLLQQRKLSVRQQLNQTTAGQHVQKRYAASAYGGQSFDVSR